MVSNQVIITAINDVPSNQLIFASKFYTERLQEYVTEASYYKTLERMCNAGNLCKIAKGTYYRPKKSKFGVVPPSQKEIVSAFTSNESGTIVGYSLYNLLKLTTQVPKNVEILSSQIEQQTKTIRNIYITQCKLQYTEEVERVVQMLDVLQNFDEIQDINYAQFVSYCLEFSKTFSNYVFEYVIGNLRYQKKTISFLRNILAHYGIPNTLNKYLSSLSEYKHPTMEEIYEIAHIS